MTLFVLLTRGTRKSAPQGAGCVAGTLPSTLPACVGDKCLSYLATRWIICAHIDSDAPQPLSSSGLTLGVFSSRKPTPITHSLDQDLPWPHSPALDLCLPHTISYCHCQSSLGMSCLKTQGSDRPLVIFHMHNRAGSTEVLRKLLNGWMRE